MATTGVEELVGRERELGQLEAFVDAALTAPRALLLEGEPGIGKTTLWWAGVETARGRGFRVLTARPAEAEASLSFTGLGDLLAELVDDIGALPDPQRKALRVALLLEEQEEAVTDSRAVSVAVVGLLRWLAREEPVLVAVDDVQWLDPATAGALTFALRRAGPEPISFLGAARPGQEQLAFETLESVRVAALDLAAVESLVRRALEAPPARPLLRRLVAASGGNPFYALELARAVMSDTECVDLTDPVRLPASLSDLLQARLATLPASSRDALAAAAALAQPTRQLLERVVDGEAKGLEAAQAAGIVVFEDELVRFTHPLLSSAAYVELEPPRRRELHRQLATVVGDGEERARHLALAVDPPDAGVGDALEEAAQRAFERGAIESSAELIERAIRFTPGGSIDALQRRQLTAVGYLARTGAKLRAQEVLREASSVAPGGPARARAALTATWFGLLDPSACVDALRDAVEDAQADPLLLAKVHSALVPMLLYSLDLQEAEHHAEIALELAEETGDSAHLVLALVGVAHIAFFAGRGIDMGTIDRAVALEAVAGNPYGNVGVAQGFRGEFLLAAGELDSARRTFESKLAEERRRGDMGVMYTLSEIARVEIQAGNWQRAEALAEESVVLAREVADVQQEALATRRLIAVAVVRGEEERARRLAAEGLRLAELGQTPLSRAEIVSLLGLLELSLDNAEAAAANLDEVARFVSETGIGDPDILPFVPDQVEALIALGDLDAAEAATAALESQARRLERRPTLAFAARCRGELTAAGGDLAAAVETLADARAAAAELGQPFELARTLLAEGSVLRRARRFAEARRTLDEAAAMFERLGSTLWARRAQRELARLGGRAVQTRELTPTEQQIAELVSSGQTNHEVAQALHVSPKTVEWNLSKIYRKLRVTSRTELAARYAERPDDAARAR